jgi:hypothetical protein
MADERWLRVYPDGGIVLRVVNGGATFLRRGAEAVELPITREELRRGYPTLFAELERSGRRDTPLVSYVR